MITQEKTCDACVYYDSDLRYCHKVEAYNYSRSSLAEWCPNAFKKREDFEQITFPDFYEEE